MVELIPPRVLIGAYAHGVFPMAYEGRILWFSPELRGVLPLDERFHIPHGLRRTMRRAAFEVRWNHDFEQVMRGCAERAETWIDETIIRSYLELHRLGFAHSVECWADGRLEGGLYGVALGRAFFGESMFSRRTDASKVALVELVRRLRECGFDLLDAQWMTPHLARFGGFEVPRADYERLLAAALTGAEPEPLHQPPAEGLSGSSSSL
jgi:leucyl/phenylalanyl-tRNA--protein transferase